MEDNIASIVKKSCQPINVDRNIVTLCSLICLYKKGVDITKHPDVCFVGEDGMDASGPGREYFHLLMSILARGDHSLHLFEGEDGHLVPVHSMDNLESGLYYYAGLMIAHSVLHHGFPLIGMSPAVVEYIITGSIEYAMPMLSIKDVPNLEIRNVIEKVLL